MRMLIVKDEHRIANAIKKGLALENYATDVVYIGARQIIGEILNQNDKIITVKLQDGSTKIILLSDKTSVNKATEVSKKDLKTGEKVGVFGTENTDGSITAQNIQLNPTFRTRTGGNQK